MFDLEETKRKYETQNVVEFVLDPNDFAYDWWIACWIMLHALLSSADFFFKINISKNYFKNTLRVSSNFDPNQARQNLGPDLGPNCLQMLLAEDTIQKILEIF